jgi:hypothetical protein
MPHSAISDLQQRAQTVSESIYRAKAEGTEESFICGSGLPGIAHRKATLSAEPVKIVRNTFSRA